MNGLLRTRRKHPLTQHVGNPHGRIAIWCDEAEALEIADHYRYPDRFGLEIGEAVERAYPKEDGDA